MSKYDKWYYNIVNRAKLRKLSTDTYVEKHHVIPKSIGGSDSPENLVKLTAREHFICHYLLTKMYTGSQKRKMIFAFWSMAKRIAPTQKRDYRITNRLYEKLRYDWVIALRQENTGKPSKIKGRIINEEWRKKLSEANLGKKRTAESRAKQSATRTGKPSPKSEQWLQKFRERKQSKESKIKQSEITKKALTGRKLIHNASGKVKLVKAELFETYINDGWMPGRGFSPNTKKGK